MKHLKTILTLAIMMMLAAGICGCSFTISEPEDTVHDFFKALKTKNEDVLILYTENEDINMLLHSKGDDEKLDAMYESIFQNFSYKILSVKKNKDETEATAQVEISNADFSGVLKKYQGKAYDYMQSNLYAGNISKKTLNAKCLSIFVKQVETAAEKKDNIKTETLTVKLIKNDNYSWDMELTEEMMEHILGGLIIPL